MSWNLCKLFISDIKWTVLKIYGAKDSSTMTHKIFSIQYGKNGIENFKAYFKIFIYTKYNECTFNCIWWFLTFSNKVEKRLGNRFIRLSVHTIVNTFQMSWNLCMLFISNIEWPVLKIVYMGLKIRLKRHTKLFRYSTANWGENFKAYFKIFMLH